LYDQMTKYQPMLIKAYFIRITTFLIMIYIDWQFTLVCFAIYVFLLLNDFIFGKCKENRQVDIKKA
jgi:ABC transporter transmembrane region.